MKKIVKHALSLDNGIILYSNIFPILGVKTYYDENDNIRYEYTRGYPDNFIFKAVESDNKIRIWAMIFNLALIVFSLFYIDIGKYALVASFYAFIISHAISDYIAIILWILRHKIMKKEGYSLSKFHAAEHMVINAYEKKQGIPTYEEIKKSSRITNDCGSMETFNQIFSKTLFTVLTYLTVEACIKFADWFIKTQVDRGPLFYIDLVILILSIIIINAYIYILINLIQILVTSKPTDRELRLAEKAINKYEAVERYVKDIVVFSSEEIEQ